MQQPIIRDQTSTYEIWVPLLAGGRIVVAPPGDLDIASYSRLITEAKISSLFLTTNLFNFLVEDHPRCFGSVKTVWTGGEAASPHFMQQAIDQCPQTVFINVYGPTETTTFATSHAMKWPYRVPTSVPVGVPLDNTRIYVLTPSLQPAPVGVAGELCIAGSGLARGYLGKPNLTTERFIADPFGPAGGRLYRTGDIARWCTGGTLEFLGRIDQQMKIRGYRVEPEEIEAALTNLPEIAHAAVVHRKSTATMTAYLVASCDERGESNRIDLASLRRRLSEILPDYMVPSEFAVLDVLPLTANMKLDRGRLPAPESIPTTDSYAYVAPRNAIEEMLADIWADILNVEHIGVHDSFFDHHGHSLLAMRLISRVRDRFGVDMPLRTLFEKPTISDFGEELLRELYLVSGDIEENKDR